jgi:peptidoglycan/LPS O-acetylase OafA/YrhL
VNDAFAAKKLSFFAPLKKISKNRVLEIDILRSVGIILVVLFHALLLTVVNDSENLGASVYLIDPLGFVGMGLFFFISGFVALLEQQDHQKSTRRAFFL